MFVHNNYCILSNRIKYPNQVIRPLKKNQNDDISLNLLKNRDIPAFTIIVTTFNPGYKLLCWTEMR